MSYRKYFSALVETNRTLGLELQGCFCLFLICVKPQEQNLQTSQLFPFFFFFFFFPFKPLSCWQQPSGRRSRSVPCGASWVSGALIGAKKCFPRHPGGEMWPLHGASLKQSTADAAWDEGLLLIAHGESLPALGSSLALSTGLKKATLPRKAIFLPLGGAVLSCQVPEIKYLAAFLPLLLARKEPRWRFSLFIIKYPRVDASF